MTHSVRRKEDVSFRRAELRVGAEAAAGAFEVKGAELRKRQYDCVARAVAALMLGRHAGMNQRDVGTFLSKGIDPAVCRQLKPLRDRLGRDRDLASRLRAGESVLQGSKTPAGECQISIIDSAEKPPARLTVPPASPQSLS
jgi:hypothetical protein